MPSSASSSTLFSSGAKSMSNFRKVGMSRHGSGYMGSNRLARREMQQEEEECTFIDGFEQDESFDEDEEEEKLHKELETNVESIIDSTK